MTGPAAGGVRRAPRIVLAPNPSPLTLQGTNTYIIGERRALIVDPGPALPVHIGAVVREVAGAAEAVIVLTHGHPDHAEGAEDLATRLGAPVLAVARGNLADGQRIRTDAGEVVVVATPGHTPDHVALYWPEGGAVFCGDLMLGGQDTALVAPPEGDLSAYLDSLERLRRLDLEVVYPAHGPPFTTPRAAIESYVAHREARQRQVLDALRDGAADRVSIAERVYGSSIDPRLRPMAEAAVEAYLEHLERRGLARQDASGRWRAG